MGTVKRRHWDLSAWQDLGEAGADFGSETNIIEFVWPGGYPVVYIDPEDDSEGLCAETVREMLAKGEWPDGKPVDSYTHYVECSCGKQIESAYGDPCDEPVAGIAPRNTFYEEGDPT